MKIIINFYPLLNCKNILIRQKPIYEIGKKFMHVNSIVPPYGLLSSRTILFKTLNYTISKHYMKKMTQKAISSMLHPISSKTKHPFLIKKEILYLPKPLKKNLPLMICSDDFPLPRDFAHITRQLSGLRTLSHFLGLENTLAFKKFFIIEQAKMLYRILYRAKSLEDITYNIVKTLPILNNLDEIPPELKPILGLKGKMSLNQHNLTLLFSDARIPKTIIEKISEGLINLSTMSSHVSSITALEIFTLFKVISKTFLLQNKNKIEIICIDSKNISLNEAYNELLAKQQTSQTHPDFLFICRQSETTAEIHFYKDIKTGGNHALYKGHISLVPGLFTEITMARNYIQKFSTNLNGEIIKNKLTPEQQKAFQKLKKELGERFDELKVNSTKVQPCIKNIIERTNILLLEAMFKTEFQNVNFSISTDPGFDFDFKNLLDKHLESLIDKNFKDIDISPAFPKSNSINNKEVYNMQINIIDKCFSEDIKENIKEVFEEFKKGTLTLINDTTDDI